MLKSTTKLRNQFLGQNIDQPVSRPNRSGPPPFSVGDKVQVNVAVEQLRPMQQGHGGWNPKMAEVKHRQAFNTFNTAFFVFSTSVKLVQYTVLQTKVI